jgi:hypothetical protein
MSVFEKAVDAVKQGIKLYNALTPLQRVALVALGFDVIESECDVADASKRYRQDRYRQYKEQAMDIIVNGTGVPDDEDPLAVYFDSLAEAQAQESAEEDYPEGY